MESFGEIIRKARVGKGLYLRQVAAELDIDQAVISKFEHGDRKPSKEQVHQFAEFFNLDKDELLIAWLSDKIVYDLQDEILANRALKVAEQKIQYKRKTI
jgi:transcriptional regulator with XRE-family HTH domain